MTGKPGCLTCMPLSMAELSAAGQPGVCASDSSGKSRCLPSSPAASPGGCRWASIKSWLSGWRKAGPAADIPLPTDKLKCHLPAGGAWPAASPCRAAVCPEALLPPCCLELPRNPCEAWQLACAWAARLRACTIVGTGARLRSVLCLVQWVPPLLPLPEARASLAHGAASPQPPHSRSPSRRLCTSQRGVPASLGLLSPTRKSTCFLLPIQSTCFLPPMTAQVTAWSGTTP